MKLIKLSSNNSKFKTLNFKPGLNIVSGLQLSDEERKSFNAVGKSLTLKLLHWMLGGGFNTAEDKKIKKYLSSYGLFQLDFTHNNKHYCVTKNFRHTYFIVNDDRFSDRKYREYLNNVFLLTNSKVSFRKIFNVFARRFGGNYYSDVLTQQGRPKEDFDQKLVNLFLLKIDTDLIMKKFKIKERLAALDKVKDIITEYNINHPSNFNDIEEKLEKLKIKKNNFEIAINFDFLKKEVDSMTSDLNLIRNNIYYLENRKKLKENNYAASENTSVDTDLVVQIYEEAKFHFGKQISNKLKDAEEFHNKLIQSRRIHLKNEIAEINKELVELTSDKDELSLKRDAKLKELSGKGALSEFEILFQKISSLELERAEAEKYKNLDKNVESDKINLNLENAKIQKEALDYINSQEEKINAIEKIFRDLVRKFYENNGGSFKINPAQDAKYLYDINIHIPRDASQGVGEVKIFCYDILLYLLNSELLNFIAHDGCIFSEMDPRQKAMIFKVVLELIGKHDLQYFVNIGENSLIEILNTSNILSDEEKSVISNSQILKLYDKDPKESLFGEDFN